MKPKALKTKELLERIFSTQVLLFNRISRIENSLSRFDPDYFDKFEGNSYRENVADISLAIFRIGTALTRPIAEPTPPAPAAPASPAPAVPAPEPEDEFNPTHIIMAS